LDDEGEKNSWYVKVIDISSTVKFETEQGNIIIIPLHRLLKIKQRGKKLEAPQSEVKEW
jgi:uncharacterized protein (UPF0248 family)